MKMQRKRLSDRASPEHRAVAPAEPRRADEAADADADADADSGSGSSVSDACDADAAACHGTRPRRSADRPTGPAQPDEGDEDDEDEAGSFCADAASLSLPCSCFQ